MSCNLDGIGVLVTRPSGQERELCELIAGHGGIPLHFPTTHIGPSEAPDLAKKKFQDVGTYQIVIFISPNSVKYGLALLEEVEASITGKIFAVGKGTTRALLSCGIKTVATPEGVFNSESLLAMPDLVDVEGLRILIVRGNGGRQLLGETLHERGAYVEYAEVYTREIATVDPKPLIGNWEREVSIVTATSCDILENLFSLLGEEGREKLCNTPLVVVSERI